jgi:acyl carrier protein phosphodiesterase
LNYLAHAYLSFDHSEVLVGNMISDFVKGKKKFDYPTDIQKGIALHRAIDQFTDLHAATKEAKEVFRSHYRLYAGAFVDVVYDHFLANDGNEFTNETLFNFSQKVYSILDNNLNWLPDRFAGMFPYMKMHNWLYNYKHVWGTERSFGGVVRRSQYLTESKTAAILFKDNYQLLSDCYRHFWAEVKPYAKKIFNKLMDPGK